jgi:hypothetical protein
MCKGSRAWPFGATGGLIVHEPVPLVEEASAASKLAKDALRIGNTPNALGVPDDRRTCRRRDPY